MSPRYNAICLGSVFRLSPESCCCVMNASMCESAAQYVDEYNTSVCDQQMPGGCRRAGTDVISSPEPRSVLVLTSTGTS